MLETITTIIVTITPFALGYLAYLQRLNDRKTDEINRSVNNKDKDEPTLREYVKEIHKDVKDLGKTVISQGERISKIEGKLEK